MSINLPRIGTKTLIGQNVKLVIKLGMKLVQMKKQNGGETHNYTKIRAFPSLDEKGYMSTNFM
jgi:hypothetical protein